MITYQVFDSDNTLYGEFMILELAEKKARELADMKGKDILVKECSVRLLSVASPQTTPVECPLCGPDGMLQPKRQEDTWIYMCDHCPAVLLEWYGPKDTRNFVDCMQYDESMIRDGS
ncbi:hypothetical protein [Bacillus thermotolerans]|uniref:hypothetical protein n=1 Tax=Bacillus thermotolerans TaxID=1221996 RepID=UPI0005890D15|nr:hypothetical protein [Bacillus thermotolerans]KKB44782.1 hypothetical protein QY96_01063 [Bacillus thermotolerans]